MTWYMSYVCVYGHTVGGVDRPSEGQWPHAALPAKVWLVGVDRDKTVYLRDSATYTHRLGIFGS